jgi:flagellar basal body-associated protein FliL
MAWSTGPAIVVVVVVGIVVVAIVVVVVVPFVMSLPPQAAQATARITNANTKEICFTIRLLHRRE